MVDVSLRILLTLFANVVFYSHQHSLFAEFNTLAVMYGQPSLDFITQETPYILVNDSTATRRGHTLKASYSKESMPVILSSFSVQILTWRRCLFMAPLLAH